jgi:hypothetical protein
MVGMHIFLSSQIRKFLGSFCYGKSANFLSVPVCKLPIRTFFMINPQITSEYFSPQDRENKTVIFKRSAPCRHPFNWKTT